MTQGSQRQTDWPHLSALFALYQGGDGPATRALFTELSRILGGFFRIRVAQPQECEDLLQATLLKIHFARDRYDPAQPLKTWVFTVASRSLIDHWRGIKVAEAIETREEESLLEETASPWMDPERKAELHGDLNSALLKLKPTERSIVYLYAVEGFSMAEIAQSLLITEAAAKIRAHRAYVELRKHLLVLLMFLLQRMKQP